MGSNHTQGIQISAENLRRHWTSSWRNPPGPFHMRGSWEGPNSSLFRKSRFRVNWGKHYLSGTLQVASGSTTLSIWDSTGPYSYTGWYGEEWALKHLPLMSAKSWSSSRVSSCFSGQLDTQRAVGPSHWSLTSRSQAFMKNTCLQMEET